MITAIALNISQSEVTAQSTSIISESHVALMCRGVFAHFLLGVFLVIVIPGSHSASLENPLQSDISRPQLRMPGGPIA